MHSQINLYKECLKNLGSFPWENCVIVFRNKLALRRKYFDRFFSIECLKTGNDLTGSFRVRLKIGN